jgi:gas vesicle protein
MWKVRRWKPSRSHAQGENKMSERVPVVVVEDEQEGSNTLAWFLAGAIIGAAVAVLCAPKSGRDTRQLIADKAQQGKDAVTGGTREMVDAGRDMFERGRKLVEDAADLFDRGRKLVRGDAPPEV